MSRNLPSPATLPSDPPILIIGAGIGGLAVGLRLASAGHRVILFEQHDWLGGKARTVPSFAGPVAAGPTVLTMRSVFDHMFESSGVPLESYVQLHAQPILARHFWADGSQLDLMSDPQASAEAIAAFSNADSADQFLAFHRETQALFDAFEGPMMTSAQPSTLQLGLTVLRRPSLLRAMAPQNTLAQRLSKRFSDPRLAQLFGRYATYVGGSPLQAPALLSLIWQAEARGVWTVDGGINALATAMAQRITELGGEIQTGVKVEQILTTSGRASGIRVAGAKDVHGPHVVFNGDPRALGLGALGAVARRAVPDAAQTSRSLSARVWSFAAEARGVELAHHNVFFGDDPHSEFRDLEDGKMPSDPTLYVCAQDRGHGPAKGPERFEIILNAPPLTDARPVSQEGETCHQRTFPRLAQMGLHLTPLPNPCAPNLTTPAMFDGLFPQSAGSIYGQSPHGLTASLARPRARSRVPGLYLCGGGTHPGAGVPMAALSGLHAAGAILTDLTSTSASPKTDMRGGMSTESAMTDLAQSR